MAQADSSNTTHHIMCPPPRVSSRRGFLAQAAAAVAGGAAIGATLPLPGSAHDATSRLLTLEKQIFEAYDAAHAYTDDITRCMIVWRDGMLKLEAEARAGGVQLAKSGFMDQVTVLYPEALAEQRRLTALQDPHFLRMDELIKEMWATPAKTPEERRAKVEVLLVCIAPPGWRDNDHDADYDVKMARALLFEMVGGQPGDILADQFA